MKRFAVNLTIVLALGLSLTLALLWLLGGGPAVIRAQAADDLPAGSGVSYPYPPQFAIRTEPDAATGCVRLWGDDSTLSLTSASSVEPSKGAEFSPRSERTPATRERVNQTLFNLPLRFIANAGQSDPTARFTVKGAGHTIFFTEEEVVFSAVSSGGWGLGAGLRVPCHIDVVPISLTHVGFTSGGAQITPTGGISYTWQVAPLAPGAGGTITLTGVVSPSVGGAFNLTNRATITTTDGYFVEENLDNNVSVVHSYVGGYSTYLPVMWR